MRLDKDKYWNRLVAYYYDNIHWDETPTPSIYQWLERDFKANTALGAKHIHFRDSARLNWFVMRWDSDGLQE
jgi:hypothetical protein